jgi:hypothetical protein
MKEEIFKSTMKTLPMKEIISTGISKTQGEAKKGNQVISAYYEKETIQNEKAENERKTLNTRTIEDNALTRSLKRKKTVTKRLTEEEPFKYEDSLEINEEKRSRNIRAQREHSEYKIEDPKQLEKIMRQFETNTLNRVNSSILLKKEKTYEKELLSIIPLSQPHNLMPLKKGVVANDRSTSANDEVFNAVLNKYLNNQIANQTAVNFRPKYKNESTDMRTPNVYPEIITNQDLYKVANIKYSGFGKRDHNKFKNKHITPEVQMKYFKLTRKKRNQSGSSVFV